MGYVWFVLSKFVVDVVPLPRLVLLLGGVFLSQILGYAAIYYITPHKTHVKGDFSAFRCTGRVNVQGQTIGTKKGTKSPHFLELHWQGLPPLVCHGIGYALICFASDFPSVGTGWQVVDSLRL